MKSLSWLVPSILTLAAACSTKSETIVTDDDGGPPRDASASTSSPPDSGPPRDAAAPSDAGADAPPVDCKPISGEGDAGLGVCTNPPPADGSACVAIDVGGGFTPSWKPPSSLHQAKCTPQNIDDFFKFCLGTGDSQACQTFLATAAGKDCAQCILTPTTAPSYGPLIDHLAQGFVTVNAAGCIAALEPCNEACAKDLSALAQCDDVSCVNCKVTDNQSLQDLEACTATAESCGCAAYAKKASCAELLTGPDHPAAACVGASFESGYKLLAPLFCGP